MGRSYIGESGDYFGKLAGSDKAINRLEPEAMMDRRQLITGLISLVAAPAIVRAGGLMPIKIIRPFLPTDLEGLIYWGSFRGIYFSNKALTPAGVAEIDGYLAGAYGPPQSSVDSP